MASKFPFGAGSIYFAPMDQETENNQKRFGIKQLAEDDRPREKLLLKGRQFLSNAELLAILIGSGTREFSALDIGQQILQGVNNNLNNLGKQQVKDLMQNKGIGEAKAITLVAAIELGRRRMLEEANALAKMTCSKDAYLQFAPILDDLLHEEFWILLLNRNNIILGKHRISSGGISGTIADPKMIFKHAIQSAATGIVLCHNHPSGNLKPSSQDLHLTKNISEAGKLLEILVFDHIIIGNKQYFSFADEGLMNS